MNEINITMCSHRKYEHNVNIWMSQKEAIDMIRSLAHQLGSGVDPKEEVHVQFFAEESI